MGILSTVRGHKSAESAKKWSINLAKDFGCLNEDLSSDDVTYLNESTALINCLRIVDARNITAAQNYFHDYQQTLSSLMSWAPIVIATERRYNQFNLFIHHLYSNFIGIIYRLMEFSFPRVQKKCSKKESSVT